MQRLKTTLSSDEIFVPITEDEFDALVKKVVRLFKLSNEEHASVIIANRIMHLPPDQATTTLRYLGHCVLKNIAYQVASAKGSKISHRLMIDILAANLKADTKDQQSRDALEKASNEGSEYATQVLNELLGQG